jgi:hypothetical protein
VTELSHEVLVKRAYEEARLHAKSAALSAEWKRTAISFREYCERAQLDPRLVLIEVKRELRMKADKYPDIMGHLYKDKRGHRCWLVARNPGKNAMFFIEGRRFSYHEVTEEEVFTLYTRYDPPEVPDAADWWEHFTPGRSRTVANVEAQSASGYWNGWYAVSIKERFYIMAGNVIDRVFYEAPVRGAMRKSDRLIDKPPLV